MGYAIDNITDISVYSYYNPELESGINFRIKEIKAMKAMRHEGAYFMAFFVFKIYMQAAKACQILHEGEKRYFYLEQENGKVK